MTEKLRYKAFGYRIIVDIQNDIEDCVDSKLETNTNTQHQSKRKTGDSKQTKYLPSRYDKNYSSHTSRSKSKSNRTVLKLILDKPSFSTDSLSSDCTFHSCKSHLSVSEENTGRTRQESSENDSDSDEEKVDTITVRSKILFTNKPHKDASQEKSLKDALSGQTRDSPNQAINVTNADEKYKDKINRHSVITKCSLETGGLQFGKENVSDKVERIKVKRVHSKFKFVIWEPVLQNNMVKVLCIQIAGGNEICSIENTTLPITKNYNKGVFPSSDNPLKVLNGEGDFAQKQIVFNNTFTQLRETVIVQDSHEACLMMLMKNTNINEAQFGNSFGMSKCIFEAMNEQTALILKPNKSLTEFSERNTITNAIEHTLPATRSLENSVYRYHTPTLIQEDAKEEEKTVTIPKVKEVPFNKFNICEHEEKIHTKDNHTKMEKRLNNTRKNKIRLPAIKEESLESLHSDFEKETSTDYCLVDTEGRPIRLFDSLGFPLTDHTGRPLKDVEGNFLMKCDDNGIPVVDFDDCNIFDMYGNRPDDEEFDPSAAPEAGSEHMKLATSVVLYDVDGNPLTSVCGSPLVDACGRSLISQDHGL